jgi:hypothetical protein
MIGVLPGILLSILGMTGYVLSCWLLVREPRAAKRAAARVAGPFVPPSPYLLDAVAAAIAQAAGHNWHAPTMMPGYRAEFRRQAAAAIDAFRAAA